MNIYIFDDAKTSNFYPLTLNRATCDLRVGILKLGQRIKAYYQTEDTNIIIARYLEELYKERHPDWNVNNVEEGESLFINSRVRIDGDFIFSTTSLDFGEGLMLDEDIIAFKLKATGITCSTESLDRLSKNISFSQIDVKTWNYPWELVSMNGDLIEHDFKEYFYDKDNYFETEHGVTVVNPYNVWIGEGTKLGVNSVLDATNGPIVIDENAEIMANTFIEGPCFIGKKSKIKVGAKIYEGTSIGPVCKVGGEVEETIIQAYTNKQHDGFLGHAYLGEWVNLGAGTSNSDLKNTYKNVKVYNYNLKDKMDSGTQFMGCIIGDHSKIGINCSINTGTVIGIGANLYGKELIDGFIPSFKWGENSNLVDYRMCKFFDTANLVKRRRALSLSDVEKDIYKKIIKD